MMTIRRFGRAITCAALTLFSIPALASDAVRIIVPFAVGDASDLVARAVAEPLSKVLERPVVVHNHYGAGGVIGTQDAVRSKTDGLTLVMGSFSNMSVNTVCRGERLGYVPSSALRPVAMVARAPVVIAVGSDSSVGGFGDLIADFTARPGIKTYTSSGLCSYSHFIGQYLTQRSGVDVVPVAYRGGYDAAQAVIKGDADVVITELPSAMGDIGAGRLKVLAVASAEGQHNAPTFNDLGYEELNQLVWYGMFVPAETPSREGRIMAAAIQEILEDPAVVGALEAMGAEPYSLTGAEIYREVVNLTRAIEGYVQEGGLQLE